MNEQIFINTTLREMTGKGANKKLQAEGIIPAVVYGHNFDSLPIAINASEIKKIIKPGHHGAGGYQLYKLLISNQSDTKETTVMIKDVQWHPVTNRIMHIDLFAVKMDEKIVASVQIQLKGKAEGVKLGGVLRQILREIEVKSLPGDIPPHFELDISELQIGESLHVSDLNADANIQLQADPDAPIVTVLAPTVYEEEKEEGVEGEEEVVEEGTEEKDKAEQPSAEKKAKE